MTRSAFVGRTRELAQLRQALDEAIDGHGRLVLVAGEPGMGKTRLVEELSTRAGQCVVLWGRCWEGGGAPSFWPWMQILRRYARDRDDARLASELGPHAPFVAHLVPELLPEIRPISLSNASEEARFALLDAVTTLLITIASATPLLLVVEDLHAADASSLLLLSFLARELADARILVVATYRDAGGAAAPDVAPFVGTLAAIAQRIELRGLDADDVARLLAQAVGSAPAAEVAHSLHAATGGNPLFVVQLVELLTHDGELRLTARLPLPRGVREAIAARVALLPQGAQEALQAACVIGDEPSLPLLQEVAALEIDPLLAALATAVHAALLIERTAGGGRFRFAHGLVRDAVYATLDAPARRALHRKVGDALERLHGDELAALAHHFCQAGDADRGIEYAIRAAERAMGLLAYEDAAASYRLALDTLELVRAPEPVRRFEILLGLGTAEQRAGAAEHSRAVFERAAAITRELGDAERLARAAVAFSGAEATVGEVDEAAGALLEEALAALPAQDSPLRARVMARRARADYFGDAPERRWALARDAVQIARSSGDGAALLDALCAEHVVTWSPDNLSDRVRSAHEIIDLAERLHDREGVMQGRLWLRRHLLELGEALAAEHEAGACERLADRLRQPRYLWQAANLRTGRALLAGRFQEAERLAREALEIGRTGRGATAEAVFLLQMRVICAEQGRLRELAPAIERLAELHAAWRVDPLYHLTRLDRRDEVRALFERLAARDFTDLARDMFALWDLAYLADACVYLRDADRAALLYDLLAPYHARCLVMGQSGGCEGSLARHLGQLAAMLERWEDATRNFEHALEVHTRLGARPLLAHTLHEYASSLLARGRPEDRARAERMLTAALATARELGMTVLQDRIVAIRRPPSPRRRVFRREGEYWRIAFEGPEVRLRDERGLAYIASLLARPGEEIHALELAGAPARAASGDAGALLDAEAKVAYRRRLADLRDELDQAEAWGDPERVATLSAEIDALVHELARAVGLGDRDRKAASASERARVSVTKAIRRASAKIATHDAALGEHLARAIKTGTFCSYSPRLPAECEWETSHRSGPRPT